MCSNVFKKYLKICVLASRQRNIFQTFGHLNCPNQSPPDCHAQGLANGNAMIITQKALGLGKPAMKCWIIRKRSVYCVWLECINSRWSPLVVFGGMWSVYFADFKYECTNRSVNSHIDVFSYRHKLSPSDTHLQSVCLYCVQVLIYLISRLHKHSQAHNHACIPVSMFWGQTGRHSLPLKQKLEREDNT